MAGNAAWASPIRNKSKNFRLYDAEAHCIYLERVFMIWPEGNTGGAEDSNSNEVWGCDVRIVYIYGGIAPKFRIFHRG